MDNLSIPIFGEKQPNQNYIHRTAAYALIFHQPTDISSQSALSQTKIAILKTPNGYYLPGGGVENDENLEAALKRELIEELGWEVDIKTYFGSAKQFFYSNLRQGFYENHGHFFLAEKIHDNLIKTEPDHELEWVTLEEASHKLMLEFQAWAIKNFLSF